MAVHNGFPFLAGAVQSVLDQAHRDFEFIIIEDASSDGTGDWLESQASADDRIKLIRHYQNKGLTKSLNRGISVASGEYIARMDGDDVAMPERFSRQLDFLRANPSVVLLGSEVELINELGFSLGNRGHSTDHDLIRRDLLSGNGGALTHPAVMIKASALHQVGGYDECFAVAQDLDLFLKLSELGRVANLSDVLLKWRQHPASINRTRACEWQQVKQIAIRNCIERCGADQIAREMFPVPQSFNFPATLLGQATFCQSRGERRASLKLALRSIQSGESFVKASLFIIKQLANVCVERLFKV
ncbi:putative glycosyltransferase EpsE [Novipirellula aureliae]|uniref:Putative glycosyltransferase EpsE n=1 Tax=Novipirellula aureliae TaxID=2527966 RepID=A0A5C6E5Y6_9BACT|nr:putative glycosyltransferase EpsE [Novipirellula aureliae]